MTENVTEIQISVSRLQEIFDEITVVDDKLAAATGSTEMGKRAYANSLVVEHGSEFESLIEQLVTGFGNVTDTPAILTAGVTAVQTALKDKFGKQIDEFLTAYVESNKSEAPEVSESEVDELTSQAKELRKQYNVLRPTLEMFGLDPSSVPEPKKMTGSRGKRGPRTLSFFDYSVDGKERSKTQNSLSSIANTVFKDTEFGTTKALREELARQGLDLQNPPETWSYTLALPDDKSVTISAVKNEEKDEFSSSDDDEDEAGVNTEEETE